MMLIFQLAYAILFMTLGLLGGGWVCRHRLRAVSRHKDEILLTRDILARVDELTTRVATDVGAHNTRVMAINDELASKEAPDSEAVVATIAKLVAINCQMQERLTEAETKLQEQSKALESQVAEARTDVLTRLPNRRALEDEMARRLAEFHRHGTSFSAVMLDVDLFKRFNDQHGHQVGDDVLRGIAGVLQQTMRGMDMAARYGGEEFVVILPSTSLEDARQAGERYRQAIEKAVFRSDGKELTVTASVGVAQFMPSEQPTLMLRRADHALYASKEAGRNCTHWHDGRTAHCAMTGVGQKVTNKCQEQLTDEQPRQLTEPSPNGPAPTACRQSTTNSSSVVDSDSDELASNECDRSAFFCLVRQRMAEWKRRGANFSVMLVRIDEFDHIVPTFGQSSGDFALRTMRRFLTGTLREMDVIGHYQCACYALLLPNTRLSEAMIVAQRIHQGAAKCELPTKHGTLQLTVSLGIAESTEGDDAVRLLQRSEAALQAAGRNRVFYHNGQWPEPVPAEHPGSSESAMSATRG